MLALVFPGQGAQVVGMGKSLADAVPAARAAMAEADAALGFGLATLCASGPIEELTRTEVSQPAIYAVSMAALRALEARLGGPVRGVVGAAGLSLGEYSALTAAGALPLAAGIRLVRARGQAMQAACDAVKSGMASVMGLDADGCAAACAEAMKAGGTVVVANINSADQIALSGDMAALGRAMEAAKARGARRVVPLQVAGAFHSPLMRPAADALAGAVTAAALATGSFPVVANAWAKPVRTPDEIRRALLDQLTAPVRWVEGVKALAALGATKFLELGPGKVCAGLIRRILPEAQVCSLGEADQLDAAAAFAAA